MDWDELLVRPLPNFHIYVELRNGSKGTCDLGPFLAYEAFEALKEPAYFAQAGIVAGAVTWPNGEDLAPEIILTCLQTQAAA